MEQLEDKDIWTVTLKGVEAEASEIKYMREKSQSSSPGVDTWSKEFLVILTKTQGPKSEISLVVTNGKLRLSWDGHNHTILSVILSIHTFSRSAYFMFQALK